MKFFNRFILIIIIFGLIIPINFSVSTFNDDFEIQLDEIGGDSFAILDISFTTEDFVKGRTSTIEVSILPNTFSEHSGFFGTVYKVVEVKITSIAISVKIVNSAGESVANEELWGEKPNLIINEDNSVEIININVPIPDLGTRIRFQFIIFADLLQQLNGQDDFEVKEANGSSITFSAPLSSPSLNSFAYFSIFVIIFLVFAKKFIRSKKSKVK